ncbi:MULTISPECIES: GNAT family N-acetyltransferase [Cyanophyceae]|uniref:GNAT family N-acetyltransferase n=1 Tax=Leptolyngbya subtilissima DQ-A4 TaxID=2933933 RepID=A0ABV0K0E0_9CYAN|nr:GNAT family N-acetyltransferase [Nodosilinea sp. FACHB-141]MBD2112547.1 GNAT family N-acetyltransferase [Nodosilinea sp. FACHB-141]
MALNMTQIAEKNLRHFLLCIGRYMEHEEYDRERIHWIVPRSPVSYYNAVLQTQLQSHEVSSEIEKFIERLQYWKVFGHWFITPSTQPSGLDALLVQHEFTFIEEEPQLFYDLNQTDSLPPQRADLEVQLVRNQASLDVYAGILAHGFEDSAWVSEVFQRLGLSDQAPFQHYVGYFEGSPIATASLLNCGDTAGVYFVCVHPNYRRRGFGIAILIDVLRKAWQQGYKHVTLGATTEGYDLYLKLGFQKVCDFRFYEFKY